MDVRHALSPAALATLSTAQLREQMLVSGLLSPDEVKMAYANADRMVMGGAVPTRDALTLDAAGPVNSALFLDHREVGILHIGGGQGVVDVDGEKHELSALDALYVGRGQHTVALSSVTPDDPARYYFVSTVAHREFPTVHVKFGDVEPMAAGSGDKASARKIYQLIHPNQLETCALLMGVTVLEPGCVWNTMPCHLHDRRSEIYFYFDVPEPERVVHLVGPPHETRHVVLANEEAVINPAWSVHSGVGTAPYRFCWATAGENVVYDDMDPVDTRDLR